jgi:hypothetical protein
MSWASARRPAAALSGPGLGVEVAAGVDGGRQEAPDVPQRFRVGPGTRLRLLDLPGEAQVSRGPAGVITVAVRGEDQAREQIRVEQADGVVQVSGPRSGGIVIGGVTIGNGGSYNFGTVIGSAGGRVIVNGVDVTSLVNGGPGGAVEPARVEVVVPAGTPVEVEDCVRTQVHDVAGPVRVDLSGQRAFAVRGATRARVDLSGQSAARLLAGRGDVDVDVSGQSRAEIDGDHDELQVDVSGQSSVQARGRYGRVAGRATGMSTVTVAGQVSGHHLRTSGMSSATVNGEAVSRR